MNEIIQQAVRISLSEDVGSGDITAQLIANDKMAEAQIISREKAIIAGLAWFEEVYRQLDPEVKINWLIKEGEQVSPGQPLAKLSGKARSLLTGERSALNWLQTLSGTATSVSHFVTLLKNTKVKLLDTRKTLPGLRYAQKYAVRCGGGHNHRMGLYDAFLIKENHIQSCGSIANAVEKARMNHPDLAIEVEVESLDELKQTLKARADIILLDNFSLEDMKQAVEINQGQAKLEVSGNVSLDSIASIAATGVDYISAGALTKHVQAVDLSMRFQSQFRHPTP